MEDEWFEYENGEFIEARTLVLYNVTLKKPILNVGESGFFLLKAGEKFEEVEIDYSTGEFRLRRSSDDNPAPYHGKLTIIDLRLEQ